jgi:hypothetical protein
MRASFNRMLWQSTLILVCLINSQQLKIINLFFCSLEIKLHKAFEKMEKRENSELMPETWLNPQWFEFSQPEYSLINYGQNKQSENDKNVSCKYFYLFI